MLQRATWTRINLLSLLAFAMVAGAQAEIRGAVVMVEGMACPFCAFGIEKRLKKVEGVESVDVSVRDGSAALTAREGASLAILGIPGAIEAAGFTPGDLSVDAIGRVVTGEQDHLILEVSGSGERILIGEMEAETRKQLEGVVGSDRLVSLVGPVYSLADGLLEISPETVTEVSE